MLFDCHHSDKDGIEEKRMQTGKHKHLLVNEKFRMSKGMETRVL